MIIVLFLFALALIPAFLNLAVFESVFFLVLATPVTAFLFTPLLDLKFQAYSLALIVLIFFLVVISQFWKQQTAERRFTLKEFLPLIVFAGAFLIFHKLTLLWPDFIAIGERLRDFAVLSSVIASPVDLKEPWMAGYSLNYYAYWYRFGQMLSVVFDLRTWDVYHLLQSFTYALYLSCAFRILSAYLGVRAILSLFFAFLLCFGSNLAGVQDFVFKVPGWWGPSRVIPGAIDEFPAWSFLLGDLHPHYLNLPLIPFFIVMFAAAQRSLKTVSEWAAVLFASLIICPLWISNSNAWEVPIWLAIVGTYIALLSLHYLQQFYLKRNAEERRAILMNAGAFGIVTLISIYYALYTNRYWRYSFAIFCAVELILFAKKYLRITTKLLSVRGLVALLLCTGLAYSLYLSRQNIVAPDYPVDFVKDPIERTNMYDLAKHFGIPLFIICAGVMFAISEKVLRISAVLIAFGLIFFKNALPILIILLVVNILRILKYYGITSKTESTLKGRALLAECLGLVGIGLIMVPEIVFLNDPYGAEIERMNTIFKVYSANWFFIHLYAFYLLSPLLEYVLSFASDGITRNVIIARYACVIAFIFAPITIYMTGFLLTSMNEERIMRNQTVKPFAQGLSEIDRSFPGSAATIQDLQKMPRGVLLEAQGNPYDWTSHVSTLSENPAFLGWANHVNLLLYNIPEVGRREAVTTDFYNAKDCGKKLATLRNEGITYAVLGPLERKKYTEVKDEDFSCLKRVINHQEYQIFTP